MKTRSDSIVSKWRLERDSSTALLGTGALLTEFTVTPVPEPGTAVLFGLAFAFFAALGLRARPRRTSNPKGICSRKCPNSSGLKPTAPPLRSKRRDLLPSGNKSGFGGTSPARVLVLPDLAGMVYPRRVLPRFSSWFCVWLVVPFVFAAQAEQVVISKIMYHPPARQPEYIEVYNNTVTPFDMANWRLAGGIHYEFPSFSTNDPGLTFLKPFERIVLCGEKPAVARAAYHIPASVRLYGPWSGSLDNEGQRVTLKDKNGVTVCTVKYESRGHWPPSADGAGHALVLKDPDGKVDDWRNWTASARPGGAPGMAPVPSRETPVASPELEIVRGTRLVDYAATWSYEDNSRDLGQAWKEMDYDDSKWATGPGLLGFDNSVLPGPGLQTQLKTNHQVTYYFRTRFVFEGNPKEQRLALDQIVDDGAVYYLNGQELGRTRMPSGAVTFKTLANVSVRNAVEEINAVRIGNALLVPGTNVLAVEVHQVKTTSTDLALGVRLRAFIPPKEGFVINELFPGSKEPGFIEFFNPTLQPGNLKGYYLSDDPGHLPKRRIDKDLVLAPGGLASIGLNELGWSATNPVSIYLATPDGASVINAVRADFSRDGRPLGRKPAGGSWFRFPEPTQGLPNVTEEVPALRLNEVHFKKQSLDWIELFNPLQTASSVQGLFLSARRDFSDRTPLAGSVPAKGCASWNVKFQLSNGGKVTLYLINAARTVLDSRVFTAPRLGESWQAFPDGGSEWYSSTKPSRNAPNEPARNRDIVINEIMYDPPAVLTNASQFIELFNRGESAVDLSGWQFEEGVYFKFPPGAEIPGRGYLVMAEDTNGMRAAYGDLPVIGEFRGKLSHHGELIRLVDRWGNLVNQVDYRSGGDWPELAAGNGSSMELINPWMDNHLPSAWRESDESRKSNLREYSCTGQYEELHVKGGPTDYKELHFHLIGDGHIVLENILFRKIGSETNYILNGTKLSDDGYSAKGWLCQGTHWASYMTNGQFHLISDGRGDNRPNRAEIDVTGMNKGERCELTFQARWISGKPRLIAQTWDHSIASSFLIDVPKNLGTPGGMNSAASAADAGRADHSEPGLAVREEAVPQVDALSHSPAVPHSTNSVKVTARVFSAAPLASVQLFHRLDNDKADGVWTNTVMRDDGLEGDAAAGDGIFTAAIPPNNHGQVVQFYVQAVAKNGRACLSPRQGTDKPALYVTDDRSLPRDLRTARFVVSAYDLNAMADGNTAKHGFRYPRHSNRYFNCTFISNEEEVFYHGEIRNSGSPWTRGGGLDRPKFKLPGDRPFRSHDHFYFDNDPGGGNFHNRVTRYWLYLLGHPVSENEIMRVVVNNFGIDLREDTEPVHNDLLSRNFKHGNRGQLYRIDDEWWFTDNWDRDSRDADWSYKGSDNPGRYRTEWMKRTNESEDDFTDLIAFFKLFSGKYTQSEMEKFLDPQAILKYAAVRGYIADWDNFTLGRGKNGFFYQRPADGLFQFLQWDSDLAFGDPNSGFYGGRIAPWLEKPYNKRLFHFYLAELQENYTKNSARFQAWLQAEEEASTAYSPNPSFYTNWCNNREAAVLKELGDDYRVALAVSPVTAPNLATNETVTLTGTAPINMFTLQLEQPKTNVVWKDPAHWRLPNLALKPGANTFVIRGFDQAGKLLQQTSVTVTCTNGLR
jgi:Lamin Tail Domain/CotH kinase protein